jgi:hypothetical protein
VDLDYKGLANTGTWLLGRLQTERDKARVLDGLEGAMASAGAAVDRSALDRTLSALSARVFLMHNVHESAPEVFETRWAMSYLGGPMTRDDIRKVMGDRKASAAVPDAAAAVAARPPSPPTAATAGRAPAPSPRSSSVGAAPVLAPDVPQYYLPVRERRPGNASLAYEPRIFGSGTVRFADEKTGVSESRQVSLLAPLPDRTVAVAWEEAVAREKAQATQQKLQTAVSLGATMLGALLGRKSVSLSTLGRATTTARGMGRTMKEAQDVKRAAEEVQAIDQQIAALDADLQAEIGALDTSHNPATAKLETIALKPKWGDVTVQLVALAWQPGWQAGESRS